MQQPQKTTDLNLLFGILTLQMDFINRDQLVSAMNAWVLDKEKPLGEILVAQNALSADEHALLHALVQKHLQRHGHDLQKSLAAVSSLGSARNALQEIADPEVQASLVRVAVAGAPMTPISEASSQNDPEATRSTTAGTPTSMGLRFRILRPHAKGGLGAVYVAHDEELHREVALKEIQGRHADDPKSRSRFVLEAEITGGLEHPGIVPVYGLGQYADGRPFYAMRFIRGDSLKEAIERFHRLDQTARDTGEQTVEFRKLLQRFIDVCNAIAYAHSRGVLHRDLKPGNIMLGKYGETLVVDWGLAKPVSQRDENRSAEEPPLQPASASGSAETLPGSALGTPQYMSPEQAAGRLDLLGPASDVYSLGATLYCLLTGRTPFPDSDVVAVLQKVQRGDFPPPRQVKRGVPPPLEAICLKAMSLKAEQRYESPRELANEVEHWLADEPVMAHREPIRARLGRWGRRHKTLLTASAVLLITAVIALTAGLVLLGRKQAEVVQERNSAQQARDQAEALTKFYEDHVLAVARPKGWAGGAGKDVTLKEALDQATASIDGALGEQPDLEAAVRHTLGMTYWYLGRFDAAGPQLEKSYALRLDRLGADHPATLASLHDLAMQRWKQGNNQEAVELGRQALEARQRVLGSEHKETLWTALNLGIFLNQVGEVKESEALLLRTVEDCKRILGPEHHHTLYGQNDLAIAFWNTGKRAEAAALHRQTMEARRRSLGADHPDTLRSMDNLADCLQHLGKLEEAEALCRQALEARRRVLGDDHLETFWSLNNLAGIQKAQKKLDEAEASYRKILADKRRVFGAEHNETLLAQQNLAFFFWIEGRKKEAEDLYRECFEVQHRTLGPDHPRTVAVLHWVTYILTDRGQAAEAEKLYTSLLIAQRKSLKSDSLDLAATLIGLGAAMTNNGHAAQAEPLLRECVAIREKQLAKDHWQIFAARVTLGQALTLQEKFNDAELILLNAYDGLSNTPVRRNDHIAAALDRLVELYEKWNKPERAEFYRKKRASPK